MRRRLAGPRLALFAAVGFAGIGCDHAAKRAATLWLEPGQPLSLWGDALRLELVRNPGAFLSLGATLDPALRQLLFLVVAPLALVLLMGSLLRSRTIDGRQVFALALVAGGGLANWIDRVLHAGAVTDFVSLGWGPLRTGVFNLADVWILGGVALLAWSLRAAPADGEAAPS